jgi:hypothetical protein
VRRKGGRETGGIRKVKVAGLDLPLLVIVCSLQDRTAPFTDQALGDALDAGLGPFAPCVEVDDLADTAAQEDLFVDGKLGEGVEDVALDVVGWQAAVVQRLEEVFDRLEQVGLGVEDGILDGRSVEKTSHLGEELKLVGGGHALLAGFVVSQASLLHRDLEIGNLVVDLVFQVLEIISQN